MNQIVYIFPFLIILLWGCQSSEKGTTNDSFSFANEKHLRNIKMLTTEGENAEAYFSFDQKKLIFQSRHGNKLVFSSNRFHHQPRDTNVFIADWVD